MDPLKPGQSADQGQPEARGLIGGLMVIVCPVLGSKIIMKNTLQAEQHCRKVICQTNKSNTIYCR
jgi:hypothetical protein